MKQEYPSSLAKWRITQFIQDHQINVHQPKRYPPSLAMRFLLLQRIDQFHRREETNPLAMLLNGFVPNGGGQMGLACKEFSLVNMGRSIPANRKCKSPKSR